MLPSDSTFFGLTYDYSQRVYEQIFDIVYKGGGGFSFSDVHRMPVNLRTFYYMRIAQYIAEQNAENERRN